MNPQNHLTKHRVMSLTGLKGIACIVVMANHFSGVFFSLGQRPWEQFPYVTFLFNGTFMVYVFYTISGFFTAYSIYSFSQHEKSIAKKLFFRYFRLAFPVLVICVAVYILQHLNLYAAYDQVKAITGSARSETTALNYYNKWGISAVIKTALIAPLKSTTQFTFVFWMLHYIYKGFFIAVILSIITKHLKSLPAICTLFTSCIALYSLNKFEFMSFAAGVLLAYIYIYIQIYIRESLRILFGALCIAGALILGSHWPNSEANNIVICTFLQHLPNYVPMFVAGSAALVAGVLLFEPLRKILSSKLFVFLGNISLGIYLVHDILQISTGANIFLMIYRLSENIALSRLAAFTSSTVEVIAGAYLIWKYLDPMISRILSRFWNAIHLD